MKRRIASSGSCCRLFEVELDDLGRILSLNHVGGCSGNLDALGMLLVGMRAVDVFAKFSGLRCGSKTTSCMDQLAAGLRRSFPEEFAVVKDLEGFSDALVKMASGTYAEGSMPGDFLEDGRLTARSVEEMVRCMVQWDQGTVFGGFKVRFSTENFICSRSDLEGMDEELDGLDPSFIGWHDGGFVAFYAGGDWQHPLVGMLFVRNGRLEAYVPSEGNVYDHSRMEAYGSDSSDAPDGARFDCAKMEAEFRAKVLGEP